MRPLARARGGRRGAALLLAVFCSFAVGSMVAVLTTMAHSSNRLAETRRARLQAKYLALGAVEQAAKLVQDRVVAGGVPPAGGTFVQGEGTADYTIQEVAAEALVTAPDGLQTFTTTYRLEATATVGGHRMRSQRIVNAQSTPLFQFAFFYQNDMELWPGPDMVVNGRIHCNGNIYFGAGSSLTLDTNYVRAAGKFFTRRKHDSEINAKPVRVRRWVENAYDPSEPSEFAPILTKKDLEDEGAASKSGLDSDFKGYDKNGDGDFLDTDEYRPFGPEALARWSQPDLYMGGTGSTLKTGEHGVSEAAVPEVGSLAMYEAVEGGTGGDYVWDAGAGTYRPALPGTGTHKKGSYHNAADLVILGQPDGSWRAWDGSGLEITALLQLADVVDKTRIYDARQAEKSGEKMDVFVIDVDKLNDSGFFPDNGLLYASAYGAGAKWKAKGFQLTDGKKLKGPLTVVSENSVYVHGDYNVDDKKPAAVIADAVNLLSNAWDGKKAPGVIPKANDTTYNTAIVTGNTESKWGEYNGGVENLPRFHEDWNGRSCKIVGSMACTWYSVYASSPHSGVSDLRVPPKRDWSYDPAFNDARNLPPFTPMTTTVVNAVSW